MQGTEDSTKAIQLEIRNYVIIQSNTLYLFLYWTWEENLAHCFWSITTSLSTLETILIQTH